MDTEKYCKTLDNLDKKEAIRAIHEAYLQLDSMGLDVTINDRGNYLTYDNRIVLVNLKNCLAKAGHIGFN